MTTPGHFVAVEVEPGDPRNDQAAAETKADLDWHIQHWAAKALNEGHSPVEAQAGMVGAFVEHPEEYPRERLAALLAAALVRLSDRKGP